MDNTKIEWTDATWNVVNGCSVISPGCTNCYAMRLAGTRLKHHASRKGLTIDTKAGPVWNGQVRFDEKVLHQPLKWRRPRRIFVCAHGDLFHDAVPTEAIDRVFAIMAQASQHQFQVLTKRAKRMRNYIHGLGDNGQACLFARRARTMGASPANQLAAGAEHNGKPWPLPNVWLGVSAENQHWLEQRVPHLLETPAAKRWISAEPLLRPLDLEPFILPVPQWSNGWLNNYPFDYPKHRLDWVVAGGESGPGARPMHPDWARDLRDQCADAAVPFHFKQWGEHAPGEVAGDYLDAEKAAKGLTFFNERWDEAWSEPDGHCDDEPDVYRIGKKRAGRKLDGQLHDGFPA
jgi:protein gp37